MKSSVKCVPWADVAMTIVVLFVVAVTGDSRTTGDPVRLVSQVGKALDRLATVRKPFSLVPGVRVVKRDVDDGRASRTRRRVTLVDSAESVFTGNDLVLDTAPGLQMRVTATGDGRGFKVMAEPSPIPEPRTFGVMRRMKLILLPIMYKLGVITTLLTLLTVFSLKGLTIGVILLIMGSVGLIHKFKVPYHHEGSGGHHKDVHVHVHGGGHSPVYHSGESYWDRTAPPGTPQWSPPPPPPDQNWRYPHQMDLEKFPWDQFIS